jgi:two-component system sensor histidine kinase KdpD
MLEAARKEQSLGVDVVIGYVETHIRKDTEALVHGLTVLPRKVIEYRGVQLSELDADAVLARKPALALVDELAHSNAPGSRHPKRYQDILELLEKASCLPLRVSMSKAAQTVEIWFRCTKPSGQHLDLA